MLQSPRANNAIVVEYKTTPLSLKHWSILFISALFLGGAALGLVLKSSSDGFYPYTNPKHLIIDAFDNRGFSGNLAVSDQAKEADVLMFGTSGVAEGLWLDEKLNTQDPDEKKFVLFGLGDASFLELYFVFDLIPKKPGQTVVIFPSPRTFARLDDAYKEFYNGSFLQPAVKFANKVSDEIPRLKPLTTQFGQLKSRLRLGWLRSRRYIQTGLKSWAFASLYGFPGTEVYQRYFFTHATPGDKDHIVSERAHIQNSLDPRFENNVDENAKILSLFIRDAKSMGMDVVLVESPVFEPEQNYGKWWAPYKRVLQNVADNEGVKLVDFNPKANLTEIDIVDPRHVSATGRDKWSQTFVNWLAEWRADKEGEVTSE